MSDGRAPVETVEGTSRLTRIQTAINADSAIRIGHFIVSSISSAHSFTISLEPDSSER